LKIQGAMAKKRHFPALVLMDGAQSISIGAFIQQQ
jgi:hypothetical protein